MRMMGETMSKTKREKMVELAKKIANNDKHGYSQIRRWPNQGTDYDCSSLMYWAAHEAGYNVPLSGYTGTMVDDFTRAGFKVVPWDGNIWDCQPGDILLAHNDNRQHTEMYIGKGQNVGAHIAESGDIDGKSGDQTGNEISIAPNWGNWDYVLIPPDEPVKESEKIESPTKPTVKPSKSLDDVVFEVILGEYGKGLDRKKALEKLGFNYSEVQKRVSKYYSIANKVIHGDFGNGAQRIRKLKKAGYNPECVQYIVNDIFE